MLGLLIVIGLITAIAQILTTFNKMYVEVEGNRRPTWWGIGFYSCTILLATLPTLQFQCQRDRDDQNEIARENREDIRQRALQKTYDSSIVVMKGRFDSSAQLVTSTLGKYGYKLDSAKQLLVQIGESPQTIIQNGDNPVLMIPTEENAIVNMGYAPSGRTKFSITVFSSDAGSAFFNVKIKFFVSGKFNRMRRFPSVRQDWLAPTDRLPKDGETTFFPEMLILPEDEKFVVVMQGTYKRLDGTGNFRVEDVYSLDLRSRTVVRLSGEGKDKMIEFVGREK